MPYAPPRADLDRDDFEDETTPTAEDLEVRHPPVGLSRPERRDFMRDEATRIARLQDRTRRNPLSRTPPRGLGRVGRREWRQADKAARKDWMARERAKRGAGGPGALIVAGVLAVVPLARIFLSGSATPTVQSPSGEVPGSTVTPTFAAAAPTPVGPRSALLAWFTVAGSTFSAEDEAGFVARSEDVKGTAFPALERSPDLARACGAARERDDCDHGHGLDHLVGAAYARCAG